MGFLVPVGAATADPAPLRGASLGLTQRPSTL